MSHDPERDGEGLIPYMYRCQREIMIKRKDPKAAVVFNHLALELETATTAFREVPELLRQMAASCENDKTLTQFILSAHLNMAQRTANDSRITLNEETTKSMVAASMAIREIAEILYQLSKQSNSAVD